jgi:hypothetical protein
MTVAVYDFPTEWYDLLVSQKFNVRSINQASQLPWSGAGNSISGPHTQLWINEVTFTSLTDYMRPDLGPILQDVDAFFSQLRGRAGVVRMSNGQRLRPWYDRSLTPGVATWSDGSTFTDGTGFASGYLPPEIYLTATALKGARTVTLGGLPVSTSSVIRRGDLLQIKPNGIPGTVPHLYKVMVGGGTNSSGQIGVAIEPALRAGVAAGDVVSLRNASTLFRMTDDSQFEIEETSSQMGNVGGTLVEALDLIP